jgi:crotonobetainyl-CoA:carnitine CoA-transferase CaiB-like acyl-CoA transferase
MDEDRRNARPEGRLTMKPMQGMRVVDISHVIAGPTCGLYLANYGAEVLKIELPGRGDVLRAGGGERAHVDDGVTVGFATVNAGKRSAAVDLKEPAGVAALLDYARGADVFIENFRPGVVERLGLGYDVVRAVNPGIVYVSISGYGQEGEWSDRGAYDHVVQALTGMMSLQGNEDDPPVKVGFPVIDAAAGMVAAQSVLAALLRRARSGEGAYLDVSMAQAAVHLMLTPAVAAAVEGRDRPRVGNRGFSGSPGGATYRCADGWIATAANTPAQFATLCRVLGIEGVLSDESLLDTAAMARGAGFVAARDDAALRSRLAAAFAGFSAAALEGELAQARVPAARVRQLSEFMREWCEGTMATAPVTRVMYPGGSVPDVGTGAKWDRRAPDTPARAPRLGEHTADLEGAGGD